MTLSSTLIFGVSLTARFSWVTRGLSCSCSRSSRSAAHLLAGVQPTAGHARRHQFTWCRVDPFRFASPIQNMPDSLRPVALGKPWRTFSSSCASFCGYPGDGAGCAADVTMLIIAVFPLSRDLAVPGAGVAVHPTHPRQRNSGKLQDEQQANRCRSTCHRWVSREDQVGVREAAHVSEVRASGVRRCRFVSPRRPLRRGEQRQRGMACAPDVFLFAAGYDAAAGQDRRLPLGHTATAQLQARLPPVFLLVTSAIPMIAPALCACRASRRLGAAPVFQRVLAQARVSPLPWSGGATTGWLTQPETLSAIV